MSEEEEAIHKFAQKFIFKIDDPNAPQDPLDKQHQTIKEYMQEKMEFYKKQLEKHKSYKPYNPKSFKNSLYMEVCAINSFAAEAEEQIWLFITDSVKSIYKMGEYLLSVLDSNQEYAVDAETFRVEMDNRLQNNKNFKKMRFMFRALRTRLRRFLKLAPAPNYKHVMREQLNSAFFKYDQQYYYAPPTYIDMITPFYLENSPFKEMIEPTIVAFTDGQPDSAIVTVTSLADVIMEDLELSNTVSEGNRYIIWTSLLRYFFDEAYARRQDLSKFDDANTLFVEKCDLYSNQSIGDLNLPKHISQRFNPYYLAPSLFRTKHLKNLQEMEFLICPIDIIMKICYSLTDIIKFFSRDANHKLAFDDTKVLLLVLVSISAPSNAVAIARFLHKWREICINDDMIKAVNTFIASVKVIYSIEEIVDEENQDEEDEEDEDE